MSSRVLIADDSGFVRELLAQACEALGYRVIAEASNGSEAIEMAKLYQPDIVVMDLVMPHYNGIEASLQILEKLPNVSIIACSSLDDEATLQKAMQAGCKAFLRKPFSRQSILSVFQQIDTQRKGMKHA